jgi:hypothetical protein
MVAAKDRPVEVESSATNVATSLNPKESEALAKNLEELSNLIDKVSPSSAVQKNTALRKVLDQARERARQQLEALRQK